MHPSNGLTHSTKEQGTPEETNSATPVTTEQSEIIALLQRIIQLLDNIDGSLADINGQLDAIHAAIP